jgi:hypothetical protein
MAFHQNMLPAGSPVPVLLALTDIPTIIPKHLPHAD